MKRILVLGSTGMLGYAVHKVLSQDKECEVMGTQSRDPRAVGYFRVEDGIAALERLGAFDYIINCIAITARHIDEKNAQSVEQAVRVNALFPHELALYAQKQGARVIHMSTYGVFAGAGAPCDEDSVHDGVGVYSKTKSLGEVIAQNVINIRTSIIGPSPHKKEGLLEWFLSMPEGSEVPGYDNYFFQGVTTLEFAELCLNIIRTDAFDSLRAESSVFHFFPHEPISKYELLNLFKEVFQKNVTVKATQDPRGDVRRQYAIKYHGLQKFYPGHASVREALIALLV